MGRMDDTDDDARYPPNPYHQNNNSRSQFSSSNRPKITIRAAAASSPQIDRSSRYSKEELEEDESDSEDDDMSGSNQAIENDVEEDDADVVDDDDGDGRSSYQKQPREDESSSPDSRGKRRKLTKFSFEFAPRAAAAVAAAPPTPVPLAAVVPSKPPPARKNPTEWTEEATNVLLEAWGTLYLQNGRKSIRSDEWTEVAKKVNETSITPRTEAQCRNRLDTLKKKYKKEILRMEETMSSTSNWPYFKKMEELMGLPTSSPALRNHHQPRGIPSGLDYGEYPYPNSRNYPNQMNGLNDRRLRDGSEQLVYNQNGEDEDESDDDESDGLPPQSNKKSRDSGFLDSSSSRMLADSINTFGKIYERIEKSRMQHMAELERMRREFHRDLEVQKQTILERAQEELQKLRQEDEESEDGDEGNNANENDEIDGSADNPSSREH